MIKCDHPECDNEARYYGYQHCYFVCKEHVKWGEEIERRLLIAIETARMEGEDTHEC
jgi:hypothetical protein